MDLSWPSVIEGLAFGLGVTSGIRTCFQPPTDIIMRIAVVFWFAGYFFAFGGQSFLSGSERIAYYIEHLVVYVYRASFVFLFGNRLTEGYKLKHRLWPLVLVGLYSTWHLGWIFSSISDIFASCLVGTWSGGCNMTLTHRVFRTGTEGTFVVIIVVLDSVFVYHLIGKLSKQHGARVLMFHTNVYHAILQVFLLIAIGANIYRLTRLPFNSDPPAVYPIWQVQDAIILLLITEFGCKYSMIIKLSQPNTNEQDLESARSQLSKAENSKNNVLRYLHHELRNNLQRMTYLSERVTSLDAEHQKGSVSVPRTNDTLHSIQTCSAYIANVVEDVLTIENFEDGILPIRSRTYDLSALLRSEFTHFEQFAEAHGRRIELENTLPDTYPVVGDPDRVRQILRILGESCIEHSSLPDDNDQDPHVKAIAKVNGSLVVRLIPAVGDIFSVTLTDPYALRSDDETRDLSHSVAHRLLRAISGHILLDQERREAQVIIPVEFDLTETTSLHTTSLHADDRAPSADRSLNMLIVDDSRINRAVLGKLLRKVCPNKINIREAENGQCATDLVLRDGHVFDVIWMDMVMPVKDGLTACNEIKTVLPTSVVIMVSANDLSQTSGMQGSAGPDDAILKPVKRHIIETVLARQKILSKR